MKFENLAYAKVNLEYDTDLFIKEYDTRILPSTIPICNSEIGRKTTAPLNKYWGMVSPDEYDKVDVFTQEGNASSLKYIRRERPQWQMVQLMELDITNVTDPLYIRYAKQGGPSIRNETLGPEYQFKIKEKFADLKIYKWILENLPLTDIRNIHCVSIEPGGLSTIHRDCKGLVNTNSSAGLNKVYKNGFVIICLNITNGGGPLWWSLDGPGILNPYQSDDAVYITNDYFMHGVPLITSRRRQVRVMGRPTQALWDILEKDGMVMIPDDYKYQDNFALNYLPEEFRNSN